MGVIASAIVYRWVVTLTLATTTEWLYESIGFCGDELLPLGSDARHVALGCKTRDEYSAAAVLAEYESVGLQGAR